MKRGGESELSGVTVQDIIVKASGEEKKAPPLMAEDMGEVVRILRDEKGFSWSDIDSWMKVNAKFWCSSTYWQNLYKKLKAAKAT